MEILPANFAASTTQSAATTLLNISPFALLIIGTLLAVVILEIIIHAIRPK